MHPFQHHSLLFLVRCMDRLEKLYPVLNITFISQAAFDDKVHEKLGLQKIILPVRGIRKLTKKDMKLNSETPEITVDPQTYEVRVNGELITCDPVDTVPMGQRYFLF